MVGGVIACYNGNKFNEFDVRFDMIGKYCGEFSITYKPTLWNMLKNKADKLK